jgi:hypothetical protein
MALSAVVAVLVVSAVAQIGPASGPYRRTVDRGYAALAQALVVQSDSSGAALRSFLGDGQTLGRVTFFGDLDALAADTAMVRGHYDDIIPPGPVTSTGQCAAAMAERAAAVASLRTSLEGVLGGRTGLGAVDRGAAAGAMSSAGTALESADASWAACRRGLRRAPGSPDLTASVWVRDPRVFDSTAARRFVAAIEGSRSLVAVHSLVLVGVVTDPSAVASAQTLVVPATTTLVTDVAVADRGNVAEEGVEIGGVATALGAPTNGVPVQRTVDLAAGASTTLRLPKFPVHPGTSYNLQITAESPRATGTGPLGSRLVEVQVQPAATLTAVTSSPLVGVRGRPVTFIADLTSSPSGIGSPTGTVTFDDDGGAIPGCDARPLHAGQATCSTTYSSASTHSITAAYTGDSRFAGSTSPAITLRVGA